MTATNPHCYRVMAKDGTPLGRDPSLVWCKARADKHPGSEVINCETGEVVYRGPNAGTVDGRVSQ